MFYAVTYDRELFAHAHSELREGLLFKYLAHAQYRNAMMHSRQVRVGAKLKRATWNCGGLFFTQRELCTQLECDILALTELHDKGNLRPNKHFITGDAAPVGDPYAGVAIIFSDNVAKFVMHTGCRGRRVDYIWVFSLCLVEGTHREHVQLVEVDAPEVAHVDGRPTVSMLNMSIIHNSKSVRGRWLILEGCISSTSLPWRVERLRSGQLPTSGCMSSKPRHLVRTMHKAATKLP